MRLRRRYNEACAKNEQTAADNKRRKLEDEENVYIEEEDMEEMTGREMQDDVTSETQSRETSKTRRGITHMHALSIRRVKGDKQTVEFNALGQPVGRAAVELQSYIGVVVRAKAKITYNKWSDVPIEVKEYIWEAVNATFIVDEKWKSQCLVSANSKWRQFKTMLTQKYVYARVDTPELEQPPVDYRIDDADWKAFVISRLSDNFKKLSNDRKTIRAKQKFPYRLSRKGYARYAADNRSLLCGDDEIDEAVLWIEGRKNKEGQYEGDDLKRTISKIDEYIKKKKHGSQFDGSKDGILPKALESREHAGCVRGVRGHVTPTQYFKTPRQQAGQDQILARLEKLESFCFREQGEQLTENKEQESSKERGNSYSVHFKKDVEESEHVREVTKQQNNVMTDVDEGEQVMEIDKEKYLAYDGSLQEKVENKKKKTKVATLPISSVPRQLYMIYCYMKASQREAVIHMPIEKDVFGHPRTLHIGFQDVDPICRMEPIPYTCVAAYLWHIFSVLKKKNINRFRLVDPANIGHMSTNGKGRVPALTRTHRAEFLAKGLVGTSPGQLCIVPCNTGFHWILSIIDPYKDEVYVFDSLHSKKIHDKEWVAIVEMAIRLFNVETVAKKARRKKVQWKAMEVPQQQDGKQCGFYIMRNMKDIVETDGPLNNTTIPLLFAGKLTYSIAEIDEVRAEWAETVQQFIIE